MSRSLRMIDHYQQVDPGFQALCDMLYGPEVDAEVIWSDVCKFSPDSSDLATAKKKRAEKLQARVGLASNVLGLTAGTAALGAAASNKALRQKAKETGKQFEKPPTVKAQPGGPVTGRLAGKLKSTKGKGRLIKAGAIGALGLQAANIGGDVIANRVLSRASKATPDKPEKMRKSYDEVEWVGEISKADIDRQLAFGWASVIKVNGIPVLDKQGDYMEPDDLEDAAYEYVMKSRKGGDMHRRTDDGAPYHAADLVESLVITPEKIKQMNLPETMPCGWWVGFKVHDPGVWESVKKGDKPGFSIHGRGRRRIVEYDSVMGWS